MKWQMADRSVCCAGAAVVMGIVNVTPDSFYDGGRYVQTGAAVEHGLQLIQAGAGMIDVGGESSRPPMYGETRVVPDEEECRRVVPVIRSLRRQTTVPISVDTVKAEVARRALDAGADAVNDISALSADPDMPGVVARSRAGAVLMHMRGTPRTMQQNTRYHDLLKEVREFLEARINACAENGIPRERLAVDPGIGFGKSVEGNLALIDALPHFAALGCPVLIGASRKSFIWRCLGAGPETALEGSLAAAVVSVLRGAHILRVHDVAPTVRAVRLAEAILHAGVRSNPAAGGAG